MHLLVNVYNIDSRRVALTPQNKCMESKETQTTKTEDNLPPNAPSQMHSKKPGESQPLTKAQADSVITREDLPALPFRILVTLVILGLLSFAAYIYYSNTSP